MQSEDSEVLLSKEQQRFEGVVVETAGGGTCRPVASEAAGAGRVRNGDDKHLIATDTETPQAIANIPPTDPQNCRVTVAVDAE